MDSRFYRSSSPRRFANPGRSSTGTFGDPYYDPAYYPTKTSPRSSADRIGTSHQPYAYPSSGSSGSSGTRAPYDSYSGRRRRNTLNEADDRGVRPNVREVVPTPTMSIPVRAPVLRQHHYYDNRPSSPLAQSWNDRASFDHLPSRHEHKKIYSVDDSNHKTKLVAERDIIESRRKEVSDPRTYAVTSGGKNYHPVKSSSRTAELNDDGYSYTDPASMYRDTEPAWRRPRSGSMERSSRPTSMIVDRGPRSSNRELGPPPSTRGFGKINAPPRREHARSSSIERSREAPKYESAPTTAAPTRSTSLRRNAPAVHQEPREHRREEYDRQGREVETRRHPTVDRFEDREVASRGFGIAPSNPNVTHEHTLDRQPVWNPHEANRPRPDEYSAPSYYPTDRSEARMPEPRIPHEREPSKSYEERPRDRDRERRDTSDRGHSSSAAPIAAGAAVGAMATLGAAEALKSRDRDRERERDRDRERERERERDRERERERERDRDRRDRDRDSDKERERRREREEQDRRERVPDDRHDNRVPEERRNRAIEDYKEDRSGILGGPGVPLAAAAYASTREPEHKPRERSAQDYTDDRDPYSIPGFAPSREPERKPREAVYDDEDDRKARERRHEDDGRERKSRRAPSSDGSGDDRPRHYVERPEGDRQKESAQKEAAVDPDEEYRRRIAQEAERSGRTARDRDASDSEREKDRRRRKEERARSRSREPRAPPSNVDGPAQSRYDDRSSNVLDTNIVQEPDAMDDKPNRSVTIVTPPKEPEPKPRGILRKPTEKFPEHPDTIREGVAPHKSQLKGKDIPVGARWTRIDRRLVNPEALEEAKERFEERMDCVIVLRVLTKEQIQKLADRTKEIREARENEYERDRRDPRDRRSHRSYRDEEDRDRDHRRDYDEQDDEEWLRERERERDRDRPRMIEAGR